MESVYVDWEVGRVRLTWMPHKKITQDMVVTSVHSVCLWGGHVLLSYIKGRGYNYPGGHIEVGETLEEAIHREVYEEGYVKGIIDYLGCLEVSHRDNERFNPNGKYPMIAYQAFYRMTVTECLDYQGMFEASSRKWVKPVEVGRWSNDHELSKNQILQAALRSI
ncbi:NUDIX domain-containing protein [Alkalihalobacillus pseudalcaliphilus]|uniref:NUDIX domain-containing protein n=1 Tax=Alkalihalobacillus pseudalcaliphilus TaxID=79884 RepID=UPI00069E94DF|nr:NUDIX domain-containing protein [Alkalihalobacillus pseudalcaliphilus]